MSNNKHSDVHFTNAHTLQRRAWIERAVASVKGKTRDRDEAMRADPKTARPQLYVVGNHRPR